LKKITCRAWKSPTELGVLSDDRLSHFILTLNLRQVTPAIPNLELKTPKTTSPAIVSRIATDWLALICANLINSQQKKSLDTKVTRYIEVRGVFRRAAAEIEEYCRS
jgi:hypothetical protein